MKTNVEKYLKEHENKELCRFITCGSVEVECFMIQKCFLKIKFYL